MLNRKIVLILITLSGLLACKKGFDGERQTTAAPETYMAVDTIFRTGENRLTTQVDANWWGISKGGFIAGFEISTDNQQTWHYTKRQDSSFLLKIPPGQDSADIVIYVRAIDNLGQADATPASTLYPIKNSRPEVKFVFSEPLGGIASINPSIVFPVLKYTIFGSDPDGTDDIKQYELYINDTNTTPYILPANTNSFILESTNPKGDSSDCKVFVNGSNNALSGLAKGLQHNAQNIVYVRVVDQALSKSAYIPTPVMWVKKVSSDLLLVNAYTSNKIFVQNFITSNLSKIGILAYDTLQATEVENLNYTQLQPDFQSQTKTFAFFKHILWFGDDASFSFSYGQRTTADFFAKGGTLFMGIAINSNFDPLSNFLDWTPIKNLVNPPAGSVFRVNNNALVNPVDPTWPTIKSTGIIASARPFEIPISSSSVGYDSLYFGGIIESATGQSPKNWTGQAAVMAKRFTISDNKTNFIISSLPIEKFNGNNNIDTLFKHIFIDELKF
ncbi:MAG: hypothetical protein K9H61_04030 [Bacteroidia bacterium]|nr:hypothetical protein [Bacteroidia bacterium]MCF8425915.1 hypothetical protein [Bacteroidia bacterium]MCF8446144.1 hypothetical protein [Bacteroidia bacterium]